MVKRADSFLGGSALVAFREEFGLTQAQAAVALGLSRRTVIGYEHNATPIPEVVRLAMLGYRLEQDRESYRADRAKRTQKARSVSDK